MIGLLTKLSNIPLLYYGAGIILAYSNSVAGKFADMTVQQGQGNIGCFFGGIGATVLSGLALIIFARYFHLGKDEYVQQTKPSRK